MPVDSELIAQFAADMSSPSPAGFVDPTSANPVRGVIHKVIFSNPESGFVVLVLHPDNPTWGHEVKLTGKMPGVRTGMPVEITEGSWRENTKYGGTELQVRAYRTSSPVGLSAIEAYLAGAEISDLGPVLARRLVDHFGADTLEVISNHPERLTEVSGIGPQRAASLCSHWKLHQADRASEVFLFGLGLLPRHVATVRSRLGKDAEDRLKENPYILMDLLHWSFKKTDEVGARLGFEGNRLVRRDAGIKWVLQCHTNNGGHCYMTEPQLLTALATLLNVESPGLPAEVPGGVAFDGERWYTTECFLDEQFLAQQLRALTHGLPTAHSTIDREAMDALMGVHLTDRQWEAARGPLMHNALVITGGPGTGKTMVVKAMLRMLRGQHVVLAAPTGRAAKRMEESTGVPASTIHRMLEYMPGAEVEWAVNRFHPFTDTTVIVDEASMLDVHLAYRLVDGLGPGCQLVLLGDVDQLQSVGPGRVLGDIIDSGTIPVVRLDHIFRQRLQSSIVYNAHRIRQGEMPDFMPDPTRGADMHWVDIGREEEAPSALMGMLRVLRKSGIDPMSSVQALTPMHAGHAGTLNLNRALQRDLNPHGAEVLYRKSGSLRLGDRVLQTRNNYDLGVFNGDIGYIMEARTEPCREVVVRFDEERRVTYQFEALEDLQLAYCMTVHKSQGGQFPCVIFLLLEAHSRMLVRNLLYTGVTRGQECVILMGHTPAVRTAVNNNVPAHRQTRLEELLIQKED